ncbi:MAG: hypothetical protein A2445_00895 [Candidatus Jacksonbacteria bacterium RIFOXYC2_FULL_44_29]|nr:MAG: hypothetical protein UW45_C0024G0022 [Parcubacteria group bacterium GW2011_GWC2_44_22]OGY75057.1 MAG: hypothetical protein A2240_00615 [Candidatus Jacksonbacteria bacterium RIFOXYA2_FULL_43_12]OGY76637.1 MAG: hypothetical protein A2295_00905 [Candidatus Jacksonbacteria bacterium RIFOXYB2_FULL_44_15]OGY79484.1 MAG: hypothetical protein A2445_00895 [Candidatus Jacksonbacteria bacterium RIFOXYC2_FULL_44_29]OGY79978.1 MAG: hypothetical protein A2550_05570 [Candidatus Jacksonbacteria bacteri
MELLSFCAGVVKMLGILIIAVLLWPLIFSEENALPQVFYAVYVIGVFFVEALVIRSVSHSSFLLYTAAGQMGLLCTSGVLFAGVSVIVYPKHLPSFTELFVGEDATQLICFLWFLGYLAVLIGLLILYWRPLNKKTSEKKEG